MPAKTLTGTVVSDKMDKTVVVAVEVPKKHALYGKKVKNTKKFMAHNEIGAKTGDIVTIQESRPFSKRVYFTVKEVK